MSELEIGLIDEGELNFNQYFLKINVTNKIQGKSYYRLGFECWIIDTASLSSTFITIIMPTSQEHFWARRIYFFWKCEVHSVRHTSLTLTRIKSCKRSETTWHSWIMKFMNNGKAFPSLDGMTCSNLWHDQPQFLPGHWQAKKYWISWDLQTPNLLEKKF